jgi:hypothetical protein
MPHGMPRYPRNSGRPDGHGLRCRVFGDVVLLEARLMLVGLGGAELPAQLAERQRRLPAASGGAAGRGLGYRATSRG